MQVSKFNEKSNRNKSSNQDDGVPFDSDFFVF
jgi:hypothetical protein